MFVVGGAQLALFEAFYSFHEEHLISSWNLKDSLVHISAHTPTDWSTTTDTDMHTVRPTQSGKWISTRDEEGVSVYLQKHWKIRKSSSKIYNFTLI